MRNVRVEDIRFDENGLIPCIVQNDGSGKVLMLGYMNRDAVESTLRSELVTFYSRSRSKIWVKGETSGNFLQLRSLSMDCDSDALLARVAPQGPTCHTGAESCFDKPGEE